jgi:hypothetical protein
MINQFVKNIPNSNQIHFKEENNEKGEIFKKWPNEWNPLLYLNNFPSYLVRSALQRRGKQRARRRSSAGARGALREQTDRGWSRYNGPASLLLLLLLPIYFIFFHLLSVMFLKIGWNFTLF